MMSEYERHEMNFAIFIGVCAVIFVIMCGTGVFLWTNYNYRWQQQCAADNGVQMENTSGARVCVKGPVQIVTIAARPW